MEHTETACPPITFPHLREKALALVDAGGAPGIAAATVLSALSDLRAGLRWQLHLHLGLESEREAEYLLDPPITADLAPYDVRDFLVGSAAAAAARGKAVGLRRPGAGRSRVGQLLAAIADIPHAPKSRTHAAPLPAAWETLAALVHAHGANTTETQTWRNVANGLRHLARVAVAHGVLDPFALPVKYIALVDLLRSWDRTRIAHDVWVLRRASAAVAAASKLPMLPEWNGREVMDAARAAMAAAMPMFAADLEDWAHFATRKIGARTSTSRTESAHEPLRDATRARYDWQVRQWASALVTLHARGMLPASVDLSTLDIASVWTNCMTVGGVAIAAHESDPRVAARRERLGLSCTAHEAAGRQRPLAVAVAELAVDAGDIWSRANRVDGELPPSILQMLFALFSVAERLAIATSGDGSDAVVRLRAAWYPQLKQLKSQLARATGHRKNSAALLRMITLPQLVCGVLPWRTLIDLPRRRRTARLAHERASHPHASASARRDASRARAEFRAALQRWAVQCTFTAEPMRHGNVAHARVGAEVLLDAEWSAEGALVRLRGIASVFAERGASDVAVTETKTGDARSWWQWSPAIVALDWAAVYLRDVWMPAVRRIRPDLARASLRALTERGEFAWLINPSPRSDQTGHVQGAYRGDGVAVRYAEAMLEGLRVLGREAVPRSLETAGPAWAWILGPHMTRTLWASYWWGLRGENGPVRLRRDGGVDREDGKVIARRGTLDQDATLKKHYAVSRDTLVELSRKDASSFEHPRALDAEMDATWWVDVCVDWKARWRDKQFPIPDALRRMLIEEGRRDYLVPKARLRRTSAIPAGLPLFACNDAMVR